MNEVTLASLGAVRAVIYDVGVLVEAVPTASSALQSSCCSLMSYSLSPGPWQLSCLFTNLVQI